MSEESETTGRYVLETLPGWLHILDTRTWRIVRRYTSKDGTRARHSLAVLNERAAAGITDPLSPNLVSPDWLRAPESSQIYPTHTGTRIYALPRSAAISALIADAQEVVDRSLELIRQDTQILTRSLDVIRRLEEHLAEVNAQPSPLLNRCEHCGAIMAPDGCPMCPVGRNDGDPALVQDDYEARAEGA